jgi:hypothetical protein
MQSTNVGGDAELRSVLCLPNVLEMRRIIAEIRPDVPENSFTFCAAVLLLAGPSVNFNVDRLARRTQFPRATVAACARRLFDNGAWRADGPVYAWRSPDDEAFWNDVAVAEGKMCRRTDDFGCIEWAAPGAWRKAYDFVASESSTLNVSYFAAGEPTRPVKSQPAVPAAVPAPMPGPRERAQPANDLNLKTEWLGEPDAHSTSARSIQPPFETGIAMVALMGSAVGDDLFPGAVWLS